ncbi:MAG TPA: acetylxylan esterase [Bryobacteraceae bacterium]|nr:acetylxylan esterase [Bryobacteraceae bacterium]
MKCRYARTGASATALCLTISVCAAQSSSPDPFLGWLDHTAQRQLDERERAIAAIRTPADADRRQAMVRAKLTEIIGGLPTDRGPLNARVTGRLQSDTHTIEKVIFESLPGFYITANLYRPNLPGRYPAVLVPAGHTQEGKPEMQILAANLAAKGFIALAYDPIGQGEREQTYLPQLGRALSGGGGNEHLELGARSILIGESVARYFIFDGIRAIDYLVSRPDVDPDRIGVAGCSGGGAITTYVGVFEPRVKAAAPGCFINSFRTLFTGPTADSEMSFPEFLASGLDTADFYEVSAPLPWLMMATTEDYFSPAGARTVYTEVRRWYELYGAEDRLQFFVGNGPHGTPRESREEIYRWMIRWLANGKGDPRDQPVKLYTNLELQVTGAGNVDDEPGSRKLYQIIGDEFHARQQKLGAKELLAELRRLGIPSNGAVPLATITSKTEHADFNTEEIRFEGDPGVTVSARLYLPKSAGRKPAVVMFEQKRLPVPLYVQRSQSTAAIAEALTRSGQIVMEVDPRDSPTADDGRPFLGNWVTNERADLVGLNLAAMRAHDFLAAVDVLAARPDIDAGSIRGYARGVKGVWLLLAAAVDQRLSKIWLDRTPYSIAAAFSEPLTDHLFDAMIPSFALHWDVSDLVHSILDRRVFWTDPTNWMNRVVPLGAPYRYRYVNEGDDPSIAEFLR